MEQPSIYHRKRVSQLLVSPKEEQSQQYESESVFQMMQKSLSIEQRNQMMQEKYKKNLPQRQLDLLNAPKNHKEKNKSKQQSSSLLQVQPKDDQNGEDQMGQINLKDQTLKTEQRQYPSPNRQSNQYEDFQPPYFSAQKNNAKKRLKQLLAQEKNFPSSPNVIVPSFVSPSQQQQQQQQEYYHYKNNQSLNNYNQYSSNHSPPPLPHKKKNEILLQPKQFEERTQKNQPFYKPQDLHQQTQQQYFKVPKISKQVEFKGEEENEIHKQKKNHKRDQYYLPQLAQGNCINCERNNQSYSLPNNVLFDNRIEKSEKQLKKIYNSDRNIVMPQHYSQGLFNQKYHLKEQDNEFRSILETQNQRLASMIEKIEMNHKKELNLYKKREELTHQLLKQQQEQLNNNSKQIQPRQLSPLFLSPFQTPFQSPFSLV